MRIREVPVMGTSIRWFVIPLIVAFLLAGCGSGNKGASGSSSKSSSKKGAYVIGFSDGFCANTWRTEMVAGLDKEAKRYERDGTVSKVINLCANGSISKQIQDINSFIAQHVNAILLIPLSGSSIAPVVKKATDLHIVTVPFNLPLNGTGWSAFDGTDPCVQGAEAAQWLAKEVKGQPGGVIGLGGTPGNSYTAAAWKCATPVFKKNGTQVLTLRYASWEQDQAKSIMATLISSYPHISGIWTDGAMNAAGAEQALMAANRPLIPAGVDGVYNGLLKMWVKYHGRYPNFKVAATIEPPALESSMALDLAVKILKGEKVPKDVVIKHPVIPDTDFAKYVQPSLPDGVFDYAKPLTKSDLKKLFQG